MTRERIGRRAEAQRSSSTSPAPQALHCTCAASDASDYQPEPRGIFHVVGKFFKPSSATIVRSQRGSNVDLSKDACGI